MKFILFRFEKLSEDIPVGGLAEKYMRMINTFSQEMDRIAKFFKKQVRGFRNNHGVFLKINFYFFSRLAARPSLGASPTLPAGSLGRGRCCR